jgi:DNA-binding MarR family transcriptional regulator/N-acetylglutamate synthase-like GNAT family acetyltransferase
MDASMVDQVRRFNRTVTQRAGALDDAFLARGRPLGQARLLWEIGPDGADIRQLRARLDLDSGYASRMLQALAAAGLASIQPSSADGRVRTARLTAAGLAERQTLDLLSDQAAADVLRPLTAEQRRRLVSAMAEVERLLIASMVTVAACDPRLPAARACIAGYFAELRQRFEQGFDPAASIPADDDDLTRPAGLLLVATLRGEPAGCGAVKFCPDRSAHLKRMWVAPAARGLGLGRRLLAELESAALDAGAVTARLETNRALTEAIEMYRTGGYREVAAFNAEPYAHHWFEKTLGPQASTS